VYSVFDYYSGLWTKARMLVGLQPEWMSGNCSPLKGAALGLLVQRPGHCYELASRMNARLGPAWLVDPKELYRPLKALEREGLVRSECVAHNAAAYRKVYRPTERSAGALGAWMSADTPGAGLRFSMRTELRAKLCVARKQDIPFLLGSLDVHERECRTLLAATSDELPPIETLLGLEMRLERTASLRHLRAELDWVVDARRLLSEFAAAL
jgi:DNA-binding PadR family transcriptional regulator